MIVMVISMRDFNEVMYDSVVSSVYTAKLLKKTRIASTIAQAQHAA